jgi:polysaccharide export outer membrane protein
MCQQASKASSINPSGEAVPMCGLSLPRRLDVENAHLFLLDACAHNVTCRMRHRRRISDCAFLAVLLAGTPLTARDLQSKPDTHYVETGSGSNPTVLENGESYLLGPGDQITVRCMNAEEFGNDALRVDGSGDIMIPFLGRVKVGGLSVRQVQRDITEGLTHYIVNPVVSVNLVSGQSQPVSVIGAVKNPGVIQLQGRKTILEVLSTAGGLREDAGRKIRLTRRLEYGRIPLADAKDDPSKSFSVVDVDVRELIEAKNPQVNIQVLPKDVISIGRTGIIYVVGEVHRPGSFPLHERESMSVLQAISLAEGLEHTAAASKARIVRGSNGEHRIDIPINLSDILSGHGTDTALRAEDILFVPNNSAKAIGIKALDSIIQLATGVVVYGRY